MTFVFLRLVLSGLDRRVAADAQTTEVEVEAKQADEASADRLTTLVKAGSATSTTPFQHLKSDAVSVVKYDRD
jgi:hypothetical protein